MSKPRDFGEFFRELKGGFFTDECAEAVQDIVAAIEENNGTSGKLTITLDFKKKAGHPVIKVYPTFKAKKPEADKIGTNFFVSQDNNLMKDNPKQEKLDLRTISRSRDNTIDATVTQEENAYVGA